MEEELLDALARVESSDVGTAVLGNPVDTVRAYRKGGWSPPTTDQLAIKSSSYRIESRIKLARVFKKEERLNWMKVIPIRLN